MIEKPRILIMDDEQNIRLLVRRFLTDKFTVLEAIDGEEAVEMARKHRPSLILMDILMPKMGGYDACSIIKNDQSTKRIPVFMLTGLGFELNKKFAEAVGADGYITKPFTSKQLLDTIGKFLKIPN